MSGPASLKCSLAIEKFNPINAAARTKEVYKNSELSLARNEFREVILVAEMKDKKKRFVLKNDDIKIHRKFVKEGKLTIQVRSVFTNLMLSNAPPHQLVQFVKIIASKLAGNAKKPVLTARAKLLSNLPTSLEGISPVTQKDVTNLKESENGKTGLLRLNLSSPLSSKNGRCLKRTRITEAETGKENVDSVAKSPRLAEMEEHSATVKKQLPVSRAELTAEQRFVLEAVKSGQNVFFTGGAGTGKSFLIRKCIGALPPDCTFVTASTGVAAYQIGGITLHAFAGIGSGQQSTVQCIELAMKRKPVYDTWRRCKHLIIDEISMVDGRFFRKLESVARAVRGNDQPFGGIQLILAGDFLQLPPVTRGKDKRVFAFETAAWQRSVDHNIELTQVKRQTDDQFVEILKSLRNGICTPEHEAILRATSSNEIGGAGLIATKLCTHTEDVANINKAELANLPGPLKTFNAVDSDPMLVSHIDSHTPVDTKIHLKVGAQIMLMKNLNVVKGLVNGARGYVKSFDKSTNLPVVQFACGITESIKPEKWIVKASSGIILTRKQLPIQLAWAFSIHKSQGMTLDCVEMSLSRVFEVGQAYVALSRAKNLASVRITDFKASCIGADQKVLRFYRNLRYETPIIQTKIV